MMSVSILPSPFDTEMLGRRVGTITVEGLDASLVGQLRTGMRDADFDLVFIRARRFEFDLVPQLPWDGLELADVKVVLSRTTAPVDGPDLPGFSVTLDAGPADAADLVPLARAIAVQSRFHRCFGEALAFRIYDTWLENSLAHQAADWCFVARHLASGQSAGLVTAKREGASADLALVATAGAFRGRGVLRLMTTTALAHLRSQGVERCTVATQLSNRAAIRAYEALGFAFETAVVDLHLRRE